jgi:AbiV family abortive infection protein
MKVKQAHRLCNLPDDELFSKIEEGIDLSLENAERLHLQAEILARSNAKQGADILENHAQEEAAKSLILFDAVRAPKSGMGEHLKKFQNHLARCIYAECCWYRPVHFGELKEYIESDQRAFYLDGPTASEWVFRNRLTNSRERNIYVDYVDDDGNLRWVSPDKLPHFGDTDVILRPGVLRAAAALKKLGLSKAGSLKIVAEIWRPVLLSDDFTVAEGSDLLNRVLREMEKKGLFNECVEATNDLFGFLPLPLHQLSISSLNEDSQLKAIKEEQRRRSSDEFV